MPADSQRAPAFRLRCFGVGDGWPSADRNHSSFLYQFGSAAVLLDCGEPVSRSFKASGLSYDLVDRIFLSHLHFDHVGGFFMLLQGFWLEGRKKPLVVHAPADGIRPLQELLRAGCIFDELLPFKLTFEPLTPAQAVRTGHLQVTPFPTTHLQTLKRAFGAKYPQAFIAFSFLLETGDRRVAHSADIGAAEDLEPLLARPVDLLVCELAHVGPRELFPFLARKAIGRIVFVHLSRECRADFSRIQALAKETLSPVQVTFATEGDDLTF